MNRPADSGRDLGIRSRPRSSFTSKGVHPLVAGVHRGPGRSPSRFDVAAFASSSSSLHSFALIASAPARLTTRCAAFAPGEWIGLAGRG